MSYGNALARSGEQSRHVLAEQTKDINLVNSLILNCGNHCSTYIFKLRLLNVYTVSNTLLHQNTNGGILNYHIYKRDAGVASYNSSLLLTLEVYVSDSHRPAGAGRTGGDTILTTEETNILHLVTNIAQASVSIASVDIHVVQHTVLCIVGAESDSHGVALLNAKVDVRETTVEGTCASIARSTLGSYQTACVPEHPALLVNEGVLREDNLGTLCTVTNQTNRTGNVDSLADKILTLGDIEGTKIFVSLHLVDGCLELLAHIHLTIGLDAVVLRGEILRIGVCKLLFVHRLTLRTYSKCTHNAKE